MDTGSTVSKAVAVAGRVCLLWNQTLFKGEGEGGPGWECGMLQFWVMMIGGM